MKRAGFVLGLVAATAVSSVALAEGFRNIREILTGFQEVPVVSTTGHGEFRARIDEELGEIEYSLSYSDLQGTITQSHIHLGQKGVNGGITVFLCTDLGNGPAGTQECPDSPAAIEGTIRAEDVSPNIPATQAARNQGLNTGEFEELVRAIRAGVTYVNIHTTTWPGGEVRSQIDGNRGHH
jgi:hypothetical protein